jgi:ribonuclease Z
MTTIDFLGKWSSNTVRGERTASIVIDRQTLVECGPHTMESLLDLHIDPMSIRTVAITHMHLDHFVGIAEFLWYRAIYNSDEIPVIMGPPGLRKNIDSLIRATMTPESFRIKMDVKEDVNYENIQRFRANHVIDDNGYRIETKDGVLFYSGDTAYSEEVVKGSENVDYLFHEMTYTDKQDKEAKFWKHSTVSDVLRVFSESKALNLVPMHLSVKSLEAAREMARKSPHIVSPETKSIRF